MNQFDKNQIIAFDLKNVASIKEGLLEYKKLLDEDKAILNDTFDVEFQLIEGDTQRRIQLADTNHQQLVKDALNMGPDGGSYYYPDHIDATDEIYISEVLFFAIALEHPELKDTIVKVAKSMVALSRRLNDTMYMWIDDMRVFGIEALYILARTDANYAYLVSQFLIPYWDDEHAVGYEAYLQNLYEHYGWSHPMIKAFIWCDNSFFRQAFVTSSEKTLGKFLKQNPKEYQFFKAEVQERFEKEPALLPYPDDDLEEATPILELYFSLLVFAEEWGVSIDENEAVLQEFFIEDTLENEAFDLEKIIKEKINKPLVKLSDRALKEKQEDDERDAYLDQYEYGDGLKELQQLFLGLNKGEELWKYVLTGAHIEALHELEQTALLPLAEERTKRLFLKMKYYTSSYRDENEIREELDYIISDVTSELLPSEEEEGVETFYQNGLILKLRVQKEGVEKEAHPLQKQEDRNQMYLRILDVFYYAFGKKTFSDAIKEVVTSEAPPLLSLEEFYKRYSCQEEKKENKEAQNKVLVNSILSKFYDIDIDLGKSVFDEAEKIFKEDRARYDCSTWKKDHIGAHALAVYLLYQDFQNRIGDAYTMKLFDFVKENVWNILMTKVLTSIKTKDQHRGYYQEKELATDEEIAQVKDYLINENTLLNEEKAIELFRRVLIDKPESAFNCRQKRYSLFDDYDDDGQRMVLICYWLSQMPISTQKIGKRLWNLWIKLAPQKTIELIAITQVERKYSISFENPLTEIAFYERLEKAGVPKAQSYAFQMVQAQEGFYNEDEHRKNAYLVWLKNYDEIDSKASGMFDKIGKNRALALDEGMNYINELKRIEYFIDLSLVKPRFSFHQQEKMEMCLERLMHSNLVPWYERLAVYDKEKCTVFDNYMHQHDEEIEAVRKLPVLIHEEAITDELTRQERYVRAEILQKKDGKLYLLQLDKAYHENKLEESKITPEKAMLPYGRVVLFSEELETAKILEALKTKNTALQDAKYLSSKTIAYLNGEVCYEEINDLYNKYLTKDYFSYEGNNRASMSIFQFIWMLEEEKLNRCIQLFGNYSQEGAKMLGKTVEKAFLRNKVREKEYQIEEIPQKLNEGVCEEEADAFLFNKLEALHVNKLHIIRLAIYKETKAASDWLVNLGASLFELSLALSVKERIEILKLIAEDGNSKKTLETFRKDASRKIRDLVEKLLETSAKI
ncbi:hypothetical protein [Tenacibaculum maritimum]|uniref:hypothetical protein n=1 Tax=Tenacibaculum maritimum TaxID=107401 RepID=UPI0012E43850|nr:hypothetical protein [Tenacibaculum maritimum]CAA0167229.1 conserved hypothetical protein [Tenacibaculum maritimum]